MMGNSKEQNTIKSCLYENFVLWFKPHTDEEKELVVTEPVITEQIEASKCNLVHSKLSSTVQNSIPFHLSQVIGQWSVDN